MPLERTLFIVKPDAVERNLIGKILAHVEDRGFRIVEARLGPIARGQVSIKLSALSSQFDPVDPDGCYETVARRLRPILRSAARLGVAVTFDMEQYAWKDLTLTILRRLFMEDEFRSYPHAEVALQAYLKDTEQDARDLLAWTRARGSPFGIRLIKGAYWDYETIVHLQRGWPIPVYAHKDETDACYERLTPFLLENADVLRPSFGTHNLRHVALAMAEAERQGLDKLAIEIQMLHGMAEPLQNAVVKAGYRLRVYIPFGTQWYSPPPVGKHRQSIHPPPAVHGEPESG